MKRDLLFIAERILPLLDERRLLIVGKGRGIRPKGEDGIGKLLLSYAKQADESSIGRLIVETVILLSVRGTAEASSVLTNAAQAYKVDAAAIGQTVKQSLAKKQQQTAKPTIKKAIPAQKVKARPKPKKAA